MMIRKIDGILLLDKPMHLTSNGALQRIKYLFSAKKAGHTGSLDPLATGMLPICFGEATKFSQFLLESDKYYQTVVQLGVRTTTGDAEGEVITTKPVAKMTRREIEEVLTRFTGLIQQIPPMYSALKFRGKPLYELARQGLSIERKSRQVNIYRLQLLDFTSTTLRLDVHCSKGTYIRTLVEDIGEQLGCGAYVQALRRLAVTPYQQAEMIEMSTVEELHQQVGKEALIQFLLPIESAVQALPAVELSPSITCCLSLGQSVMLPHPLTPPGVVRIFSNDNQFIGVGEILQAGRLIPRRLVSASRKVASGNH